MSNLGCRDVRQRLLFGQLFWSGKKSLSYPLLFFFIKVLEISTGTNRKGREAKKKI